MDSTPLSDGRDPAEVAAEQRAHLARHDEVYMRLSTWGEDIERAEREIETLNRERDEARESASNFVAVITGDAE